ncbi:hypothetical protein BGLA2_280107 [Burkholderia gladioli]|nr:hypothetical protein BGLA2_280107 [Burkholderia gladioli]
MRDRSPERPRPFGSVRHARERRIRSMGAPGPPSGLGDHADGRGRRAPEPASRVSQSRIREGKPNGKPVRCTRSQQIPAHDAAASLGQGNPDRRAALDRMDHGPARRQPARQVRLVLPDPQGIRRAHAAAGPDSTGDPLGQAVAAVAGQPAEPGQAARQARQLPAVRTGHHRPADGLLDVQHVHAERRRALLLFPPPRVVAEERPLVRGIPVAAPNPRLYPARPHRPAHHGRAETPLLRSEPRKRRAAPHPVRRPRHGIATRTRAALFQRLDLFARYQFVIQNKFPPHRVSGKSRS